MPLPLRYQSLDQMGQPIPEITAAPSQAMQAYYDKLREARDVGLQKYDEQVWTKNIDLPAYMLELIGSTLGFKTRLPGRQKINKQGMTTKYKEPKITSKPVTKEDFLNLGYYQRGKPEETMRKIQDKLGGGVLDTVVEHGGDLMHRMNDPNTWNRAGHEYIRDKVTKLRRTLERPYGFEKELQENLSTNAKYYKQDITKFTEDLYGMLEQYAKDHAATPVFNRAQQLVRDFTVAIGKRNWDEARRLINIIDEKSKNEYDWKRFAHEGYPGLEQELNTQMRQDRQLKMKINADALRKRIEERKNPPPPVKSRGTDFIDYLLEEAGKLDLSKLGNK